MHVNIVTAEPYSLYISEEKACRSSMHHAALNAEEELLITLVKYIAAAKHRY